MLLTLTNAATNRRLGPTSTIPAKLQINDHLAHRIVTDTVL